MSYLKSLKVAFVIPALNEAAAIASVVKGITPYGKVIVVNDGSTDGTGELARSAGAIVVTHSVNKGYDAALASGLEKAILEGFEVAITVDGDGQHDVSGITNVLYELHAGADLVVGTRNRYQRISEAIFAYVARKLWAISDPLCGMKGYRLSKLKTIGQLHTYPSIGTELILLAARKKWQIRQVPALTHERKGNSKFGSGLRANWLIIKALYLGLFRY
jgi:glycosyltransferase involved in cell wall biosynthesis